jgi:hypothetical protein
MACVTHYKQTDGVTEMKTKTSSLINLSIAVDQTIDSVIVANPRVVCGMAESGRIENASEP